MTYPAVRSPDEGDLRKLFNMLSKVADDGSTLIELTVVKRLLRDFFLVVHYFLKRDFGSASSKNTFETHCCMAVDRDNNASIVPFVCILPS